MKEHLFPAIRLTLVCLLFFCGFYTLVIFCAAQLAPGRGEGEVVLYNGRKQYARVGQQFTADKYFWPRPSAVNYNAAGAGGSNKGPSNPQYLKTVQERTDTFLVKNPGVRRSAIPSDLVTASGSGLDPDISVQAAAVQVRRIARARGIAAANIQQLILSGIEHPWLGLFGPEKINVLKLNMALDNL